MERGEWQARAAAHRARVRPWVADRIGRAGRGQKHPVRDFLFEYYAFRPGHLSRWSPGADVVLDGADPGELDWPGFEADGGGAVLPAAQFPAHRRDFLGWAVRYLEAVGGRDPAFGCFGMHEWAMVYRDPSPRHRVPLRLGPAGTDAVVEGNPVRCTHFDAYRFFTPAAVPLNRTPLTRDESWRHDQPGCVHVTMDLYKWAFVIAPYSPAELVADAFELAMAARELDMRASPYDLRTYGFEPISVDTRAGREEYAAGQRGLYERGRPVREAILGVYRRLFGAGRAEGVSPPSSCRVADLPPLPCSEG